MLTLTDMFCGAGGSSTGAIAAPGVEVRMAFPHEYVILGTHKVIPAHVCEVSAA